MKAGDITFTAKIELEFTAKIELEFTREEVETLATLAENHYDGLCRSLVRPGRGAIINGMRNSFDERTGISTYWCTWRDLDLLSKVCEQAAYYRNQGDVLEIGSRLYVEFGRTMTLLAEAEREAAEERAKGAKR